MASVAATTTTSPPIALGFCLCDGECSCYAPYYLLTTHSCTVRGTARHTACATVLMACVAVKMATVMTVRCSVLLVPLATIMVSVTVNGVCDKDYEGEQEVAIQLISSLSQSPET